MHAIAALRLVLPKAMCPTLLRICATYDAIHFFNILDYFLLTRLYVSSSPSASASSVSCNTDYKYVV